MGQEQSPWGQSIHHPDLWHLGGSKEPQATPQVKSAAINETWDGQDSCLVQYVTNLFLRLSEFDAGSAPQH